jgi:hypothetical protein
MLKMSSLRFGARLDMSRYVPPLAFTVTGVDADSLTGIHNATMKSLFDINRSCISGVPTGKISRGFKPCELGGHALRPPLPMHQSLLLYFLLRTSRTARLQCAWAPSWILLATAHKLNASDQMLLWILCLVIAYGTSGPRSYTPFSYTLYMPQNRNSRKNKWCFDVLRMDSASLSSKVRKHQPKERKNVGHPRR